MPDDQILAAIQDLKDKVTDHYNDLSKTLFGADGRGGMNQTLINLEAAVSGDRGLVKEVFRIKDRVEGKRGITTEVTQIKERQRIWNAALGIGHVVSGVFQALSRL